MVVLRTNTSCIWDYENNHIVIEHKTEESVDESEEDSLRITISAHDVESIEILKKADWFTLKDCYYALSSSGNEDGLNIIKDALTLLREQSKKMIADIIKKRYCKTNPNEQQATWYAVKGPNIDIKANGDNTDEFKLPPQLDKFFPGAVSRLECHPESKKQLLLISFGSEAVTSDFDFSLFIYDPLLFEEKKSSTMV